MPTPTQRSRPSRGIQRASRWLDDRPGIDYLMIRVTVLSLAGIGIVMVLSSSMLYSLAEGGSAWGTSARQGIMVTVGLVALLIGLRVSPGRVRTTARLFLGVAFILLLAVLIPGIGTGREEVGSQSWISLGGLQLQPSEVAKIALAVWGADFLGRADTRLSGFRSPFTVFAAVAGSMVMLIFIQGDVGMAASVSIVALLVIFFAGVDLRWIAMAGIGIVLSIVIVVSAGGYRSQRLRTYGDALFGNFEETQSHAYQSYQGFLSLADGGLTGVGLGQSRAKWFYLPEAHNDFIFAIIGEELGWIGGAAVIVLFGLLGFFGLRTAMRAQDRYQSLLAVTLTGATVSQAFINIGYVVGLLPVTGIQLPMISSGGTSAIITLGAMGLLANVARHEPANVSSVQSYGRPLFDRLFLLPEPRSVRPPTPSRRPPAPRRSGPRGVYHGVRPQRR